MQIQALKAKRAEYEEQSLQAMPVANYPWFSSWYQRVVQSVRDTELYNDNRKRFTDMFGKQAFCWKSEFYYHCWLLDIDGKAQILVMTAKDKGTCYEVVTKRDGIPVAHDKDTVIAFLNFMVEQCGGGKAKPVNHDCPKCEQPSVKCRCIRPTDDEIELEARQWGEEHNATHREKQFWILGARWARSMGTYSKR